MVNDGSRGKSGSCHRFLVDNIIVKGTVLRRKKVHPKDDFPGFWYSDYFPSRNSLT